MDTLKQLNPARTVCFSGHRPDRQPGSGNPDSPETQKLITALRECIIDTLQQGKDTFINGFMAGWDIQAAEQIISLKAQYPYIKLVTVAPYEEQFFTREKCWTDDWVKRARVVWLLSDIGVTITKRYRTGIYYERNRAIVDYSSELICYWDGGKGGTKYTLDYAKNRRLIIRNLVNL